MNAPFWFQWHTLAHLANGSNTFVSPLTKEVLVSWHTVTGHKLCWANEVQPVSKLYLKVNTFLRGKSIKKIKYLSKYGSVSRLILKPMYIMYYPIRISKIKMYSCKTCFSLELAFIIQKLLICCLKLPNICIISK